MTYDSRPATLFHSQRVGELMAQLVKEILDRSTCHDRSKTDKGYLDAMGKGLKHHYEHNRHHRDALWRPSTQRASR
jgi:hypothetical protein